MLCGQKKKKGIRKIKSKPTGWRPDQGLPGHVGAAGSLDATCWREKTRWAFRLLPRRQITSQTSLALSGELIGTVAREAPESAPVPVPFPGQPERQGCASEETREEEPTAPAVHGPEGLAAGAWAAEHTPGARIPPQAPKPPAA